MDESIRDAVRVVGGSEALMSRALGGFMLCAGSLVVLALAFFPPQGADFAGLYAVGAAALLTGAASVIWASRARAWTVHLAFAFGTGLICLGAYFAELATGAYSVMLIWLVVIAASLFSARAIAAHVAWILVASGVALSSVEARSGISSFSRWALGSLLLAAAAAVMSQIVAGRRETEERLRREIAARARLQEELEHLAHHDPLTGLANRRRLEHELSRELARAERRDAPICVIALDLDGLKRYNDEHGHAAGDRLLKAMASEWSGTLRASDMIARTGGDEFVAVLPDCPLPEAERMAASLCPAAKGGGGCSAGAVEWDRHESPDRLLARADEAMYRVKATRYARDPGTPSAR